MSDSGLMSALLILFAAIFTNNIVLTNFLGLCSFLSVSRQIKSAIGLGWAVTLVTGVTAALNWLVYHELLVPLGLEYLRYVIFIVVIAAFVQLTEIIVERFLPPLYYALGIFLPLITVNCAVLGVSLFMVIRDYSLLEAAGFGFGSGLGFLVGIPLLAAIRWRIRKSNVPTALRGAGIAMIITGIMALAFVGFSGMIAIN